MNKNRLILTLILSDGYLMNSRNFTLNVICNIPTMMTYLNFESFDELVIINVSRRQKNVIDLCNWVQTITSRSFLPVCCGGGIRSVEDCRVLLDSGADKVIINTAAVENPELITKISQLFGKQFVVASIDVIPKDGRYLVCTNNGATKTNVYAEDWARTLEAAGAGEIYLRSIVHDGSATGYDTRLIELVSNATVIPIIAAGGFGEFSHLEAGINAGAQAVSIGNMFHFVGEGLDKAKAYLSSKGMNFPKSKWAFSIKEFGA